MRRSLILSTMIVVLIAVASIAVPLSFLMMHSIESEAQYHLEAQAGALAQHFTEEVLKGESIAEEVNADTPPGYRMDLVMTDGTKLTKGPQGSFSSEIRVTVAGPNQSTLTLTTTGDVANRRTRRALLIISLTSAGVIVIAVLLAWWEARRLARPLADVAATADEMSAGDLSRKAALSGMPEVDAVADALNRLAERVNALLLAEREFSTNASHQLRGGLTALRLRLEALTRTGQDAANKRDAKAALSEAEKLSDTVADLLQLARTGRAGDTSRYDLARLVRQHVARFEPAVQRAGRDVHLQSAVGATADVLGSSGAIGQAVDVLLSNALEHGRGDIRVDVTAEDGAICVTVADDGFGIADESRAELFSRRPDTEGHGIGLALARTLVEAEGGRLDLVQARPPVFEFILPVVHE